MSLSIERASEIAAVAQHVNVRFGTFCASGNDGLWRVYGKDATSQHLIGTLIEPQDDETPAKFAERLEAQLRIWGRVEKSF